MEIEREPGLDSPLHRIRLLHRATATELALRSHRIFAGHFFPHPGLAKVVHPAVRPRPVKVMLTAVARVTVCLCPACRCCPLIGPVFGFFRCRIGPVTGIAAAAVVVADFDFDPDFYAARFRLLICLAHVSVRDPDQTELGGAGIADLGVDRARTFNRDGDRAAVRANLWQPVFRRSSALSRARDRSSARAKFNREIIFVQARGAPPPCLR